MEVNVNLKKVLNKYHEHKLAHAYLIETNDIERTISELKEIIKEINCKNSNIKNCQETCNVCHLIDNDSYPSLKLIKSDGLFIKKEQIDELETAFSKSSQYGDYNAYIVVQAQFLNNYSANALLKFLEEPENLVLGFYITDYKERVISTIVSRCQVINNYYEVNNIKDKLFLSEDSYNQKYNAIKSFLTRLELEKKDCLMYNKSDLLDVCVEQKDIINIFKIMLDIYSNCYKHKNELENEFALYQDFEFLLKLSNESLLNRINVIKKKISSLDYNVNNELLLDDFIICLEEIR